MEEEVKQLLQQLMFGTRLQQDRAYDELRAMGIPANKLEEIRQKGAFKKDALQAAPPDNTRVIQAVEIPEPFFAWNKRKSREQAFPSSQQQPTIRAGRRTYPPRSNPNPMWKDPVGHFSGEYIGENLIPLSNIGLALTGIASEYKLKINNFDLFKEVAQNGKFIANWKGRRVWSVSFPGNGSVPSSVVKTQKAAFNSTFKTLKLIKWAGRFSAATSALMIGQDFMAADTKSEHAKAILDGVMLGVAFIPGPGWVISGVYFLADASLSLAGVDWWDAFWHTFLALPDAITLGANYETVAPAFSTNVNVPVTGLMEKSGN